MSMSSELSRSKKQCMKLGWMNRKLEEQLQASRDRVDSQVMLFITTAGICSLVGVDDIESWIFGSDGRTATHGR